MVLCKNKTSTYCSQVLAVKIDFSFVHSLSEEDNHYLNILTVHIV